MVTVLVDDVTDTKTANKLTSTSGVVIQALPKFVQSPRIQRLAQRSRELAISGARRLGTEERRHELYPRAGRLV